MSSKVALKSNFKVQSHYEPFYTGGSVAFFDDDSKMVCHCGDDAVITNVLNGQVVTKLSTKDDPLTTLTVSPNGSNIVTSHKSTLLRQWDVSGEVQKTWKSLHTGPVTCLKYNSSSELLASAGVDGAVRIWNPALGSTHSLRGALGVCRCLVFHPTATQLWAAGDEGSIRGWDISTGDNVGILKGHFSTVTALAFTPDGSKLNSCGRDKVIILWDTQTKNALNTLVALEALEDLIILPHQTFPDINVSTDSLHFITAGQNNLLRVWNADTGKEVYRQDKRLVSAELADNKDGAGISQIHYMESSKAVAVITHDHNIVLHSIEKKLSVVKQITGYNEEILGMVLVGEHESHLIVVVNSPVLRIYQVNDFNCQLVKGHTQTVLSIATWRRNKNMVVTSSKDSSIRIWNFDPGSSTLSCVAKGTGHTALVSAVGTSVTNVDFLISGSQDNCIKFWQVPKNISSLKSDEENLYSLSVKHTEVAHNKAINCVAVSPNDRLLATASEDHTAIIWNTKGLSMLGRLQGHTRGIWHVQFSPSDQVVATSSTDTKVKLWSLSDYSCLKTFEGHESSVLQVHFLSHGLQLLTSASDGLVKLWTISTNECVKTFDEHEDKVWSVAVSEDERSVWSGGADSHLIQWLDVTEEEKKEEQDLVNTKIVDEQKLSNLIHNKQYTKALSLAINLQQPFKALRVIEDILSAPNGKEVLKTTLKEMGEDNIRMLLEFIVKWNTNSKHCYPAQTALNIILSSWSPKKLLAFPAINSILEGLLPYTERHVARVNRLIQGATFIDYTCSQMNLSELSITEKNTALPEEEEMGSSGSSSEDEECEVMETQSVSSEETSEEEEELVKITPDETSRSRPAYIELLEPGLDGDEEEKSDSETENVIVTHTVARKKKEITSSSRGGAKNKKRGGTRYF